MALRRTQLANVSQYAIQQALDKLRQFILVGLGKVKVTGADTTADYLRAKLVEGANITLTVLGAPGYEQVRIDASGGAGGIIVWNAPRTWASVYAEVLTAGGTAIVAVPNDGPKEMTPNPAPPGTTDLSGVMFVGLPDGDGVYPTIDIDSAGIGGFQLGGNHNLQSKDIHWRTYYQIGDGLPACWTLDGGSFASATTEAAYRHTSFHWVLRNGAFVDGSSCTNTLILGVNVGATVQMFTGAALGPKVLGTTKTLPAFPVVQFTRDASTDVAANAAIGYVPGAVFVLVTTLLDESQLVTYDDTLATPLLGANEVQAAIDALKGAYGKSLASATDSTLDYLSNKLVAGSGIALSLVPGLDEKVQIDATGAVATSGLYTAAGGLAVLDVAAVSVADTAVPASASTATARSVVGVVTSIAAGVATVQYVGEVPGFVGLVPAAEYWLDAAAGAIVTPAPIAPGRIIRKVGVAKNATTLVLDVGSDYVELAP